MARPVISKKADDADNIKRILPGTPEMEQHLAAGYGITIDEAKRRVKMFEDNPGTLPWEKYQQAKAMLIAYESMPVAIDTEPGWKRFPNEDKLEGNE